MRAQHRITAHHKNDTHETDQMTSHLADHALYDADDDDDTSSVTFTLPTADAMVEPTTDVDADADDTAGMDDDGEEDADAEPVELQLPSQPNRNTGEHMCDVQRTMYMWHHVRNDAT